MADENYVPSQLIGVSNRNIPQRVANLEGAALYGEVTPEFFPDPSTRADAVFVYGPTGAPGLAPRDEFKGDTGPSGTIAIGSVSTLPPNSNPEVTNVGTSTAAVLNFGFSAPEKGDKGDPGEVTATQLNAETSARQAADAALADADVEIFDLLEKRTFPKRKVTIVGDSTADWFMPTATTDPAHGSEPPYVYIKNQNTWAARLEAYLRTLGNVDFTNLAVAGTRMEQSGIDTKLEDYQVEEGQDGTGFICFGHNDFNFGVEVPPADRAAAVYAVALIWRQAFIDAGYTEIIIICPTWYHTHRTRDVIFSQLAAADEIGAGGDDLWKVVIDQGYNEGWGMGYTLTDAVHQGTPSHQTLFNRIRAQWIEKVKFLTVDTLLCGPGGWFPTTSAATAWVFNRRAGLAANYKVVGGDILCVSTNNQDVTANRYGDGNWLGHGTKSILIEVTSGCVLYLNRTTDLQASGAQPSRLEITGAGTMDILSNYGSGQSAALNKLGSNPNIFSIRNIKVSGGIWFVSPGKIRVTAESIDFTSSTWEPFGSFSQASGFVGGVVVGPNTYVIGNHAVINCETGTDGVKILHGCTLINTAGGKIETETPGPVNFAAGSFVSNSTPATGKTWGGTAPGVLDAGDY